jgi:hypothetical protein
MEADWEFEVGREAPVIEALWAGFVDLRQHPERVRELVEAAGFPALAAALQALNAPGASVWTSKCDTWPIVEPDLVDPGEMDAEPASATHAAACYIDLLPRSEQQWLLPALAADWCKALCGRLHPLPLRCCRADLVIRRAFIAPDLDRLGVTAYLTACGASSAEAGRVLEMALAAFAGVFKDQL